ncbi:MAG: glycosyltransferase family 2 protein [Lachnospiraceae bacterium]|nr:glycosyltransferase family 2 protein [Lachnospiraceae bacterium]
MRLSVIVPVYNMAGEDKLKHCLDSLLTQTLPADDYEVIAVDDASMDDSLTVLKSLQSSTDRNLTVLHLPVNHHQGGAKNAGLAIALGDWISFIDADDWVTPDFYERLLSKAEETGADMVGCDYSLVDRYTLEPGKIVHNHNGEQTGPLTTDKYRRLLLDSGSLVVKIYKRHIVFGPEKTKNFASFSEEEERTRRIEQIERNEGRKKIFPEDIFYEDNAVAKTWMLRAKHFAYIEEPLYFYLQHQASTVHTLTRKNMDDRKEAARLMLKEAKAQGYYGEYKEEIDFAFTVLFYVNTLFSVMRMKNRGEGGIADPYRYTKELGEEFFETVPDFRNNRYYRERISEEERNFIDTAQQSHLRFYLGYKLLWKYRALRYGKS